MKIIGLTGNIASGKSLVAGMFEELGAKIIDADRIAREVVLPGAPAWKEIVREFGREVLNLDGTLNRAKLGEIIFAAADKREKLNRITHPPIMARTREIIEQYEKEGVPVVFFEAALIVERGGLRDLLDALVVVASGEEAQIKRLDGRNALSSEEAMSRIKSQMTEAEKLKRADFVVDNSGDIQRTRSQVTEIWKRIISD